MKRILQVTFGVLVVLAIGCDKKNDPAPAASGNEHVNNWIYDNMSFLYYYQDAIPATKPDVSQAPDTFFKSLLSSSDRFSWIQENYKDLINSLQGISKEAGYEFQLYRESPDNNNVIGQVIYVKPNSSASQAGMKRGDVFNKINDQQITTDNYKTLISSVSSNHSLALRSLDIETKSFADAKTVSLVATEYAEDPNFLNKVITINDRKIGYYVLNFFAEGTGGTDASYSDEMDAVFSSFQSAGITDLVVDLRYNSGGALVSARHLASLIGKNTNSGKIFSKQAYNSKVMAELAKTNPPTDGYYVTPFLDKAQNVGSLLTNGRIYILTGSRTASASELVINGLKPYMDVYLIGNTTVGKNVGSVSVYDDSDPENTWGMQPIILKLFNSQNQSDYDNGFTPQVLDADNSLYIYPLGDTREQLLNHALVEITGLASIARQAATERREVIFHSDEIKQRSGVLNTTLP